MPYDQNGMYHRTHSERDAADARIDARNALAEARTGMDADIGTEVEESAVEAAVNEVVHEGGKRCNCESHKLLRQEQSKLGHAVVHEYGYEPRRWRLLSTSDEPNPPYYLGVELETDNYFKDKDGSFKRSDLGLTQAAAMRAPKQMWIASRDGSVSGPEFVSHPATLAYWHSKRKQLETMFTTLLHAGYRSHDNDKAGMHVSISTTAFADSGHLYRFLSLIHSKPAWSLRMSQRTRTSADHWAKVEILQSATEREQTATDILNRRGYRDRYSALNVPGDARYEFRLPRGTLRIDRFFKNLEWTAAMVEYSRGARLNQSTPAHFMQYVADNAETYPNLHAFIVERQEKLNTAAGSEPKPYTLVANRRVPVAQRRAPAPVYNPLDTYTTYDAAHDALERLNGAAGGTRMYGRPRYTLRDRWDTAAGRWVYFIANY